MLSRLRNRFIRTAMVSVLIVLAVILSAINLINYRSYINESDRRIDMIEKAGGSLSDMRSKEPPADTSTGTGKKQPPQKPDNDPQMAEAPYDTRYFSAQLDSDKNIISTNMTDIASITETQAGKMIRRAVSSGRSSGRMGGFRYRLSAQDSGHYLIIFLNVAGQRSSFLSFLRASVIVGVAGVVAVFILMHFLSGLAMAPSVEAFEKQKRFITDASHEIKTPLAIIGSNAEVIEIESGESRWISNIKDQVRRLTALTEKLVMLSKMDEAGYQTQLMQFDLAELVRDLASTYEDTMIHVDVPGFLPYYGSREDISTMLSMLFDNAEKYSTGDISVSLEGTPSTYTKIRRHGYTLMVSDQCDSQRQDGNLDGLLERFSRMDESRDKKTGGSGIGLAVVAEIVRYHKGDIHLYTKNRIFYVKIQL